MSSDTNPGWQMSEGHSEATSSARGMDPSRWLRVLVAPVRLRAMRAAFRRLLTFVLIVTLVPGWVEVLENLEHLAHDGHLAHYVDHADDEDVASHEALEAEHGCTPLSHICDCHSSMPALLEIEVDLPRALGLVPGSMRVTADDRLVSRANAPPVPPPTC